MLRDKNTIISRRSYINELLFIIGITLILLYSTKVRVFGNPDEGAHYLRAYEVAHGHLFNTKDNIGTPINCTDYITIAKKYAPIAYYQDLAEKGGEACHVNSINSAGTYPPTAYLFLATAIVVGDTYGLTIEENVIFARFFNGFFCILLIYVSICYVSLAKYSMYGILFSPMLMLILSAISADGVTIALSFAFFALLTQAINSDKTNNNIFYLLLLVSALIGSTKIIYCLLCFSYMVVFINKFGLRINKNNYKEFLKSTIPGLTAAGVSILSLIFTDRSMVYLGNGAQPLAQVDFILHNPIAFMKIIFGTITNTNILYQIFTPIHLVQSQSYILVTIFIVMLISWGGLLFIEALILKPLSKVFILIILIVSIIITILPLYMTYTPPGYSSVLGVQGRYFIPTLLIFTFLVPLFPVLKYNSFLKMRKFLILIILMTNFLVIYQA
ncbi:DUF2142 domain-containing protein [Aeromonas sp. R10-2]|uniref:DUF2142 domain-containing protein n=1 Tax=Aeromonas sp. R10-2 TaxID=3138458 RepID=UPI0034A2FCFE